MWEMSTEDNPVLLLVDGVEPVHIDDTEDETRWSEELRLVLIGRTGSGKSASGNTILGRGQFVSQISASSVTQVCEQASTEISEGEEDEGPVTLKRKMRRVRRVQVVDMPGFGDTHLSVEQIYTEITKCVCLSAPGPHAFLLVVPLGRYTDCEDQAASELVKIFGEDALRHHTVVLFTRGDDLEGIEIEKYLNDTAPARLKALIDRCGGRYHVLNNRDPSNTAQVKELIVKVDTMQCDRGFYTNDMFLEAEAGIREEEKRMLKERGQAEGEERREEEIRSKIALSPNILNRVKSLVTAGATGLAVGAMFGAAVPLIATAGASLVGLTASQFAGISAAAVANAGKAVVAAASGKTAVALGTAGGCVGGTYAGVEAFCRGKSAVWQVSKLGVSALGVAAGVGVVLPIVTVVGSTAGAAAAGTVATGTATAGTAATGTVTAGTAAAGTAATGIVAAGTVATGTAATGTAAAGTAAVGTAAAGTAATGTATVGAATVGTAAAGTAAAGTAATGTAAVGTAAAGTVAAGTAATGTAAVGTAAMGTAAAGTVAAGTAATGTSAVGTATAGTAAAGIAIAGVAKLLSNSLIVKVKKENDTEKSSYVIRWNK